MITVTQDDLDQWIEDALTQGIAPATYIYGVLSAALGAPAAPETDDICWCGEDCGSEHVGCTDECPEDCMADHQGEL